jgi:hypothetical protein
MIIDIELRTEILLNYINQSYKLNLLYRAIRIY